MDPLCHTLVGTTLAETGLKRRTTLATATLVIGANLPDVDALTYFAGDALAFRRGWTHGLLAVAVWPFVLAGVMIWWDRLRRRFSPARGQPPPDGRELLKLAGLAVLTHPTLDFMNNYGMRWLMPFDDTWFYGDALYIVDPWVWLALACGTAASWWLGRRGIARERAARPACIALACAGLYAIAMLASGQLGRPIARAAVEATGVRLLSDPMMAPAPGNPMRKTVIGDLGDAYIVTLDDVRFVPPEGASWAARVVHVPKAAARGMSQF